LDFELLVGILPQVFIDGLVLGFMYALIALGYTMVYGVLQFINFAHSEVFIVGAFVGVEIMLSLKSAGVLDSMPWVLVLLLVLLAGMAASGLLAYTVERVAYRPLRHAPRLIPLISAIGVSFFLQDAVRCVIRSESWEDKNECDGQRQESGGAHMRCIRTHTVEKFKERHHRRTRRVRLQWRHHEQKCDCSRPDSGGFYFDRLQQDSGWRFRLGCEAGGRGSTKINGSCRERRDRLRTLSRADGRRANEGRE